MTAVNEAILNDTILTPMAAQAPKVFHTLNETTQWQLTKEFEYARLIADTAELFAKESFTKSDGQQVLDDRIAFYYDLCFNESQRLHELLQLPEAQRAAQRELLYGLFVKRRRKLKGRENTQGAVVLSLATNGENPESGSPITLESAMTVAAGLNGEVQHQNTKLKVGRAIGRYDLQLTCRECSERLWGKGTHRQELRDVVEFITERNDSGRIPLVNPTTGKIRMVGDSGLVKLSCGHVRSRAEKDGRIRHDVQKHIPTGAEGDEFSEKYKFKLKDQAVYFVAYQLAYGPKSLDELLAAGEAWLDVSLLPLSISPDRIKTALKTMGIPLSDAMSLPAHLREAAQSTAPAVAERLSPSEYSHLFGSVRRKGEDVIWATVQEAHHRAEIDSWRKLAVDPTDLRTPDDSFLTWTPSLTPCPQCGNKHLAADRIAHLSREHAVPLTPENNFNLFAGPVGSELSPGMGWKDTIGVYHPATKKRKPRFEVVAVAPRGRTQVRLTVIDDEGYQHVKTFRKSTAVTTWTPELTATEQGHTHHVKTTAGALKAGDHVFLKGIAAPVMTEELFSDDPEDQEPELSDEKFWERQNDGRLERLGMN